MKHKMKLDPDADGSQWTYRGMVITEQLHPLLLPFCCYDDKGATIGSVATKREARSLIDKYIYTHEATIKEAAGNVGFAN